MVPAYRIGANFAMDPPGAEVIKNATRRRKQTCAALMLGWMNLSPASRDATLDMLRGAAILGVVFLNLELFGLSMVAADYPPARSWGGADAALWVVGQSWFAGAMRGLLSLLFGAGAGMLLARVSGQDGAAAADQYLRRNIGLMGLGLFQAHILLWPGDVLFIYGLAGVFLYPLRAVSPRGLFHLGAGVLGLMCLGLLVAQLAETSAQAGAAPLIEQEEAARRGGYIANFQFLSAVYERFNAWRGVAWSVLDALGFMLIGMGLQKAGGLHRALGRRLLIGLALLGFAVGGGLRALDCMSRIAIDFTGPGALYALEPLLRLLVTGGHLAALLLAWSWRPGRRWLQPLRHPGRMALSVYVAQTVICGIAFGGFGFGLFGELNRAELLVFGLGLNAALTATCLLWLRAFQFGPLEWAWRSWSYGRRLPLRRGVGAGDALAAA